MPFGPAPEAYTAEYVIVRLEHAGRTLLALPSKGCLPAGMKSNWPDYANAAIEGYGYNEARVRPPVPRARAITEMDEAYGWVALVDDERRRKLVLFRALVDPVSDRHRFSWRRLSAKFGLHIDTVRMSHARGIDEMVSKLNRARPNNPTFPTIEKKS